MYFHLQVHARKCQDGDKPIKNETNSQQATEGKRPDTLTCRLCKKSVIVKGGNKFKIPFKCHHPLQHSEAVAAKLKYKNRARTKHLQVIPFNISR